MKQSEQINELMKALAKARETFKPVKKDQTNPFFKSKYASFETCVAATEPSLTKNGLLMFQAPDYVDGKMVLVTRLMHTSGQWIGSSAPLLPVKQDSQSLGSSITYMKRYSWVVMVGLPGTELDDDGESERVAHEDEKQSKKTSTAVPTITKAQVVEFETLINGDAQYRANIMNWLKNTHKVTAVGQIPPEVFVKIKTNSEAKRAQEESKIHEIAF